MENKTNENTQKQKSEQEKVTVTRAEKSERMKSVIRELLAARDCKWNEFLDAATKAALERFPEETGDVNALKGRIGSVFDVMEKAGEVRFEAGVCSLAVSAGTAPEKEKAQERQEEKKPAAKAEKKPAAKKTAQTAKPAAAADVSAPAQATASDVSANASKTEEKPAPKRGRKPKTDSEKASVEETSAPKKRGRKPKADEVKEIRAENADTQEKLSEKSEKAAENQDSPAPKKRGRKPKAENAAKKEETVLSEEAKKPKTPPVTVVKEEKNAASTVEANGKEEEKIAAAEREENASRPTENKAEEKPREKQIKLEEKPATPAALTVKPEAKVAPVFDMTLLLGGKTEKKPTEKTAPVSPAANAKPEKIAREEKPLRASADVAESAVSFAPRPAETPSAQPSVLVKSDAVSSAPASSGIKELGRDDKREITDIVRREIASLPKEEPKKALPEFAFLGNASSKNNLSVAQETKKLPVRQENGKVSAERVAEASHAKQPVKEIARETNKPAAEEVVRSPQPKPPIQPQTLSAPQKTAVSETAASGRRDHRGRGRAQTPAAPEEALKAEFLKRLRALGGDYFEYYSVYLLERYSLKNGRRLEGMRVSGGERDGGIDGEITLTDKFGFRETIYIQAKNWDPSKGKEELWVIGETLLQQFIGAVACRQAKEGIQHSRGIFVTTSHFTPEGRELLESMSDKFVGYDGDDVFEAAKECCFGLKQENGVWILDENLLSGGKAFFNLL